jgi:hypothetical protein
MPKRHYHRAVMLTKPFLAYVSDRIQLGEAQEAPTSDSVLQIDTTRAAVGKEYI